MAAGAASPAASTVPQITAAMPTMPENIQTSWWNPVSRVATIAEIIATMGTPAPIPAPMRPLAVHSLSAGLKRPSSRARIRSACSRSRSFAECLNAIAVGTTMIGIARAQRGMISGSSIGGFLRREHGTIGAGRRTHHCDRMPPSLPRGNSKATTETERRPADGAATTWGWAIDQGTTSTRAVVYDCRLRPVGQGQVEVPPTYPNPGWVEHDPKALVDSAGPMVVAAMADAGVKPDQLAGIGLTNQRETTIVWDRKTGKAIGPALVWQDRRTAPFCERHRDRRNWLAGAEHGLVLDSYFSRRPRSRGFWITVSGARKRAEAGELAAGTVDSLLIWHLTGGARHVTDATNASRTLLMDLRTLAWADDLCDFFAVPRGILPEILPSAGEFGRTAGLSYLPDGIPIAGVAGDQQASLVGQGCLAAGQAKCTYGTGAFLLAHTGDRVVPSTRGLVTTLAATLGDGPPQYALEGSVFVAGAAVQWFRDGLKAVGAAPEIDVMATKADPSSEVVFVPALTGSAAPPLGARRPRDHLRPRDPPRSGPSPTSPVPRSKG